jgi:ADP-heptose:LPS heptosyltransferase
MSERPKLLAARIGAIGDICLLMPVMHALSRHFDVHWLIRDTHIPVVQTFPHVDCRLIGVSPGPDTTQPFPPALVAALRAEGYAALIDFSHWQCIAWLAGQLPDIAVRAVTLDPEQDAVLGVQSGPPAAASVFTRLVPVPPDAHQVTKWLTLVRAACGVDLQLDWPLPALAPAPRDRPLRIFVHPHASKPEKLWPARHFATVLAGAARRRRVHCLINGVGRRITHELRLKLLLSRATAEVVPLDPSFARLRQAVCSADLALGCDSGPLQFAALLGVPTLVLYGRYPAAEFGPLWRSVAVSPAERGRDADAIAPAQVSDAVREWMDTYS